MRLRVGLLIGRGRGVVASLVAIVLVAGLVPLLAPARAEAQSYTLGIDVSHYQGTIDWTKVAESGQAYVFQKATEGATFTDPSYVRNRSGAGAVSIPFGAYHFAYAQGGSLEAARADAISEASYFLQVAQPQPGDLVPVLDLEKNPQQMPPARLIAWTQAWLNRVETALGVKPLIYTNPNFWTTQLNDTATFAEKGFPLWIAHYTSAASPRVPASNWAGRGWAFWQYTSDGTVPGISGRVDRNRYAGSDLSPYVIPGAPEPEPTPEPATPPSNESPPAVQGEAEVGRTLSATTGTWSGSEPIAYSYAWFRCTDAATCEPISSGATEPSYEVNAADRGFRMKVVVTASNSAGSAESDSALTDVVVEDATPPETPRITHPYRARVLAEAITARWTEPEPDLAYDVRYRTAGRDGDFGSFSRLLSGGTDTSTSIDSASGTTYCFSVRGVDRGGNASRWSPERCTLSPLDDRDLRSVGHWGTRSRSWFYRDTLAKTQRLGASLVIGGTKMRSIHVLAQRCEDCGKVAVLLDGRRVATVSLAAKRFRNRSMVHAVTFSRLRRGKVKLVVVSRRAPVNIDGLALTVKT